jgi:hypothetical protein
VHVSIDQELFLDPWSLSWFKFLYLTHPTRIAYVSYAASNPWPNGLARDAGPAAQSAIHGEEARGCGGSSPRQRIVFLEPGESAV